MTRSELPLVVRPSDEPFAVVDEVFCFLTDLLDEDDLGDRRRIAKLRQALADIEEELDRLHSMEDEACAMWECPCMAGDDCDCSVPLGWCVVTSPVYRQRNPEVFA